VRKELKNSESKDGAHDAIRNLQPEGKGCCFPQDLVLVRNLVVDPPEVKGWGVLPSSSLRDFILAGHAEYRSLPALNFVVQTD